MNLAEYFENTEGTGILATADSNGNVDVAVYARPHCIDDKTLTFIMNERLSYKNVNSNPRAAYLFIEKGPGYKGTRLYLTKVREDSNPELIASMKRKKSPQYTEGESKKYLVYFSIDRVRALVGE